MSSVLHPVGPERRATYWRRRLVAVLLLVLLGVAAALGVRALLPEASSQQAVARLDPDRVSPTLGAGTPSAEAAAATASPSATAPTSSAPERVEPCTRDALEVALTSEATAYGPGVTPRFVLTVRNASETTCSAEIGSGMRSFAVLDASGEQVWSSADCQSSTSSQDYELEPGDSRSMRTTWSRQRSAAGCPDGQPVAEAGTYTVQGSWNDVAAEPLTVTLTG
ncbi:BsuPI-related putative proteinase inhibitor [Kineococcus auxinigenes]|uniref:BsuPI-related putative proteinase inhibitor n=1 Tax=unclassified Kineococcus TaxID=2621656 RepID=UPI003D7DCD0A